MVLPIAYILKDAKNWRNREVLDKLEYWYWSSLFSGAYLYNQNIIAINHISDLFLWISKKHKNVEEKLMEQSKNILNANKYSDLNTLLYKTEDISPPRAIHNGILQYILSLQPRDFLKDELILNTWDVAAKKEFLYEEKTHDLFLNDHHILPLSKVTKIGETTKTIRGKNHIINSPLNRTYISSVSNSIIRDKSPQNYFEYVSEPSQYGHVIPTPINEKYKRGDNETDNEYYERILKERYNLLRAKIIEELDNLIR